MWTTANRPKYNRDKLRYPSDLTGEEWTHIEALIPAAKHGDRTGCQWRYVPKDLPPKSTLYDYFDLWSRPTSRSLGRPYWPCPSFAASSSGLLWAAVPCSARSSGASPWPRRAAPVLVASPDRRR
jgi:transposase